MPKFITIADLTEEQRARNESPVAERLRAILEEARAEHEVAAIAHAVASAAAGPTDPRAAIAKVAASMAVTVALSALAFYVARGFAWTGGYDEASEDALQEACRLAQQRIQRQVRAALDAGAGI
jgi:hypothetical protein